MKLINVSERFWLLDGKKKTLQYNKKYLVVNMDNFVLDIEALPDNYFISENHYQKNEQKSRSTSLPPAPPNINSNITFELQELTRYTNDKQIDSLV